MALEVVNAGDVQLGDQLVYEEYDEHCTVEDYSEAETLAVTEVSNNGMVSITIQWPDGVLETGRFDEDQKLIRVKR